MNKQLAIDLRKAAELVARNFSRADRVGNPLGEVFQVEEVIPASDHAAVVRFRKSTGKVGLAFFYYIPRGSSRGWRYFFPTDSHVNGFRAFEHEKYLVERENYKYNFNERD